MTERRHTARAQLKSHCSAHQQLDWSASHATAAVRPCSTKQARHGGRRLFHRGGAVVAVAETRRAAWITTRAAVGESAARNLAWLLARRCGRTACRRGHVHLDRGHISQPQHVWQVANLTRCRRATALLLCRTRPLRRQLLSLASQRCVQQHHQQQQQLAAACMIICVAPQRARVCAPATNCLACAHGAALRAGGCCCGAGQRQRHGWAGSGRGLFQQRGASSCCAGEWQLLVVLLVAVAPQVAAGSVTGRGAAGVHRSAAAACLQLYGSGSCSCTGVAR